MIQGIIKTSLVVVLGFALVGCATTSAEKKVGNVTVRRYVEDRPRVDQELKGNGGYIYGTPKFEEERKDTRKMYYVEFSKDNPSIDTTIVQNEYKLQEPKSRSVATHSTFVADSTASIDDTDVTHTNNREEAYNSYVNNHVEERATREPYYAYSEPTEAIAHVASDVRENNIEIANSSDFVGELPQSYVIQKNDTLQKISKKFYGGYSKWTKLYEANKDILKDPNTIIPGKTITIPAL